MKEKHGVGEMHKRCLFSSKKTNLLQSDTTPLKILKWLHIFLLNIKN